MTAADAFTEVSAVPAVRSVPLAHLSVELGHLYFEDFEAGEERLREHFRRVAPWVRPAVDSAVRGLPPGHKPRISTCFLIDDYFTKFSSPPEVVTALVATAAECGLTIDYVARESGCARAGEVDVATIVQQHLVDEPVEGSNGGRPPASRTGWLANGERSPASGGSAMSAPEPGWRPPRQSARRNHSIFVDVELWSDGPGGRLWSCPFLAAVWQLQRLGLLRNLGEPIADPVPATPSDLPREWEGMPAVVQLNPSAGPFRAYRTFTALDARFLPVELAVRTILGQVAVDTAVTTPIAERARREGLNLPIEPVDRIAYAFV
ncbi:SCO2522 family protein [Paractinoplanes brasiliensis]|uniref:Uncharacterized protein n=1 Tax=Paractinoplanes brasiliensis TaxID=52695 RepID=A0A4R6K054_9ACTN|nr:SCO2522 family protein [Actinoplanes brasiliensis]TDO42540.1 hypothetical protein C8E87_6313 [Actinoplanes brasiliensis]GID31356.1 hypothetical protein Abr02nite_63390 [Actinoplanes brasiliensis]